MKLSVCHVSEGLGLSAPAWRNESARGLHYTESHEVVVVTRTKKEESRGVDVAHTDEYS